MARDTAGGHDLPRDLGDGLVLRRATPADAEALATFNADLHRWPDAAQPNEAIAAWTRDLLSGEHPTTGAGDFTLVEDTRAGAIASSLCLISQTWSYGGIPFGIGRPELVGTGAKYRRRGLVRAQFEVIHRWSAERGELAQAITGIYWYYRQFGYELGGLTLGGDRSGSKFQTPKLAEGAAEPYRLRPATEADLPLIARLYEGGARRRLVECARDEALWRYELRGRLAGAEPWSPGVGDGGDAGFPGLTFLQLLFGYRTLAELRYAFADCWAGNDARALLIALFPKQASNVWPVC